MDFAIGQKGEMMDDTISRQAAIEAMGKAEWAKERLRELPSAQPEQRWIPCSERLPKSGKTVLITNDK